MKAMLLVPATQAQNGVERYTVAGARSAHRKEPVWLALETESHPCFVEEE